MRIGSAQGVFRVGIWLLLWLLLFVISLNHHPTVLLDLVATSVMIATAAIVFWLSGKVRENRMVMFVTAGALAVVGGIFSAATISLIYDDLWGPDSRRFGFVTNVLMDTGVVTAALSIVAVSQTAFAKFAQRRD